MMAILPTASRYGGYSAVSSTACAAGLFLLAQPLPGQPAPETHPQASPAVSAMQLTGQIVVDGRLDEEVWRSGTPATDFIQRDPTEGRPATQRTEVRFATDARSLYIGARMFDSMGAEGVRTRLTRRDQRGSGDWLEIDLDPFHDHSGVAVFRINPSEVKFDAGQGSSDPDPSWDPVWAAAARIDSLGWTAELRIPLSQLRFPSHREQVWGLQLGRYVERLNETSMWSFWGKDEAGGPQRFGHLTKVVVPERVRGIELTPYVTMRAAYRVPTQPGSPFQDRSQYKTLLGGDLKAVLSSSITLDASFNPDFGQVEVDPAVVNLSAFETGLDERRPFFVAGSGLFEFGGTSCFACSNAPDLSIFHSRRIGRQPQGSFPVPARFTDTPENTRILGAVKVAGRSSSGLQLGFLNAVTGAEHARAITAAGERLEAEVEPLTNYLVARVRRSSADGRFAVGAIGSSVLRHLDYEPLALALPSRATAVGIEGRAELGQQRYALEASLAATEVSGDEAAILRVQKSSARYFDRPDRQHGSNGLFSDAFDPSLQSLRGFAGYLRAARIGGNLRWEGAVNVRSPGFDVNEMNFQRQSDYLWMNGNVLHQWTTPTRFYRQLRLIAGLQQQYNFDGDRTGREARLVLGGETANFWDMETTVRLARASLDDKLTRGGPVVMRPAFLDIGLEVDTDSRKSVVLSTDSYYGRDELGAYWYRVTLRTQLKPAANMSFTLEPRYGRTGTRTQFVASFTDPSADSFHGRRVVFAELAQYSASLDTRAAVTFTPTLSLELYAQPLIASGEYSGFSEFVAARTLQTRAFNATQLREVRNDGGIVSSYQLDPDRNPATAGFSFNNPDFNRRSLRGNLVVRWEYRPGSTLFFVWQQNRSAREPFGDLDFGRDAREILDPEPDNIFMIKGTYWFGR